MKITLLSEDAIRLVADHGPITIEALSPEQSCSHFHMPASNLAFCTFSAPCSRATRAQIPTGRIAIEVRWTFAGPSSAAT